MTNANKNHRQSNGDYHPQKPDDFAISALLELMKSGAMQLPNFQRQQAWEDSGIKNFLQALYNHNPLGAILMVGYDPARDKKSQLTARPFEGITPPSTKSTKITHLLLDGQQRLTTLYKVFDEKYPFHQFSKHADKKNHKEKIYCIKFFHEADDNNGREEIIVAKDMEKSKYEDLIKKPYHNFNLEKLLPLTFFDPRQSKAEWEIKLRGLFVRLKGSDEEKYNIKYLLSKAHLRFSESYIPRFLLDSSLSEKEVVDIFIGINTGSAKLSHYDIAVANIQKKTGKYIEYIADKLENQVGNINEIDKDTPGELILKIACLIGKKAPSGANYMAIKDNYENLIFKNEERIINGIKWAVKCFDDCKIWNEKPNPSALPLRVLPALHENYLKYVKGNSAMGKAERRENADRLINRYIWHTFFAEKYKGQANNAINEDCKALVAHFESGKDLDSTPEKVIPIFSDDNMIFSDDDEKNKENIKKVKGFPTSKGRWSQGILLACLQGKATDLLSGKKYSKNDLSNRTFHHIVPKSKFVKPKQGDSPLNCLLTCDEFGSELPGEYLYNICKKKSKEILVERLASHCISEKTFKLLMAINDKICGADEKIDISNGLEVNNTDDNAITKAYKNFIDSRAADVVERINKLLKDGEL